MNSLSKLLWLVLGFVPLFGGENKVALITGASRGVGLATAEYLAEKGFTVYGTVRGAPPVGGPVQFIQVDLMSPTSISCAVDRILDKEGHIDILINNAGYAVAGPVESQSEDEIRGQMEVNFFAPVWMTQAVLPAMRKERCGHIMNISSINAFLTAPFGSFYSASKAALESFSEALAVELLPYNIAVSIVEPGLLKTQFIITPGTREVDAYEPILTEIKASLATREPESFPLAQSAEEIAAFLYAVIQDPSPKLRYQTSDVARELVSFKLLDLTGDRYLKETASH